MRVLYSILILLLPLFSIAQSDVTNTPVPYTLGDRDRIMRTEFKVEKLEAKMETEHKAIREKIEIEHKAIYEKMQTEHNAIKDSINFSQAIMLAILTLIIGQFLHTIWINNRKENRNSKSTAEFNELLQRMEKMEAKLNTLVEEESFDKTT